MRVLRSLFLAAFAGLLVSGCDSIDQLNPFDTGKPTGVTPIIPKPTPVTSVPFPFDRTMVAVRYKDQAFKDDRPTMLISTSYRGTGFSACNNWSATIFPRNTKIFQVGPVAISKRVCSDRLMHNEKVFLFVLNTAQKWSYDGKTLTIEGPYGRMDFESAV
jgi:heat shock protein HslJ